MPEAVNCISYARYRVGLDEYEVTTDPPTLRRLLEDFNLVPDRFSAMAVAVLSIQDQRHLGFGIAEEIEHMAVIEPENPNLIRHRKGFYQPISPPEPIDEGLWGYLVDPDSDWAKSLKLSTKVLYLVPKEEKLEVYRYGR